MLCSVAVHGTERQIMTDDKQEANMIERFSGAVVDQLKQNLGDTLRPWLAGRWNGVSC